MILSPGHSWAMTMSMMAGDVFPCFEEILEHSDVEPADPSERPSGEAGAGGGAGGHHTDGPKSHWRG